MIDIDEEDLIFSGPLTIKEQQIIETHFRSKQDKSNESTSHTATLSAKSKRTIFRQLLNEQRTPRIERSIENKRHSTCDIEKDTYVLSSRKMLQKRDREPLCEEKENIPNQSISSQKSKRKSSLSLSSLQNQPQINFGTNVNHEKGPCFSSNEKTEEDHVVFSGPPTDLEIQLRLSNPSLSQTNTVEKREKSCIMELDSQEMMKPKNLRYVFKSLQKELDIEQGNEEIEPIKVENNLEINQQDLMSKEENSCDPFEKDLEQVDESDYEKGTPSKRDLFSDLWLFAKDTLLSVASSASSIFSRESSIDLSCEAYDDHHTDSPNSAMNIQNHDILNENFKKDFSLEIPGAQDMDTTISNHVDTTFDNIYTNEKTDSPTQNSPTKLTTTDMYEKAENIITNLSVDTTFSYAVNNQITFQKPLTLLNQCPSSLTKNLSLEQSALKIQSVYRMYLKRSAYQYLKETSISIQKIWRHYQCRRKIIQLLKVLIQRKRLLEKITSRVQRKFREDKKQQLLLERKKENAVVRIQSVCRMWLTRTMYVTLRNSTLRIQSTWKMYRVVSAYNQLKKSSIVIQRFWRRYKMKRKKELEQTFKKDENSTSLNESHPSVPVNIEGLSNDALLTTILNLSLEEKKKALKEIQKQKLNLQKKIYQSTDENSVNAQISKIFRNRPELSLGVRPTSNSSDLQHSPNSPFKSLNFNKPPVTSSIHHQHHQNSPLLSSTKLFTFQPTSSSTLTSSSISSSSLFISNSMLKRRQHHSTISSASNSPYTISLLEDREQIKITDLNTRKNSGYKCQIQIEIVKREGVRPASPAMKRMNSEQLQKQQQQQKKRKLDSKELEGKEEDHVYDEDGIIFDTNSCGKDEGVGVSNHGNLSSSRLIQWKEDLIKLSPVKSHFSSIRERLDAQPSKSCLKQLTKVWNPVLSPELNKVAVKVQRIQYEDDLSQRKKIKTNNSRYSKRNY